MRGLALKMRRFRHGRACPGHPRGVEERTSNKAAQKAAIERLEVLEPTSDVSAWMPGTRPGMTQLTSINHPFLASQHPRLA
jgi:hypothetical protein